LAQLLILSDEAFDENIQLHFMVAKLAIKYELNNKTCSFSRFETLFSYHEYRFALICVVL